MSFFTSLFSCCLGRPSSDEAEAKVRHDRIVNMYASSSKTTEPVPTPPPCYADISHDQPVFFPDEKPTPLPEEEPQYPPEARRSSISSRSSIVSVPSTRLSDLTSMYTGTTRRMQNRDRTEDEMSERNGSWRSSHWNDSAPPSYYAGSERSITPVPTPAPLSAAVLGGQHPVMEEEWLDNMRFELERQRRLRELRAHRTDT